MWYDRIAQLERFQSAKDRHLRFLHDVLNGVVLPKPVTRELRDDGLHSTVVLNEQLIGGIGVSADSRLDKCFWIHSVASRNLD